MPTVTFHRHRCGVVAGHDEHVGLRGDQGRKAGIGFFDGGDFRGEITIFAGGVGRLDVDENKVVSFERFNGEFKFLGERVRAFNFGHADELGETFVHRINRDAGRFQAVPVLETRNVRLVGDAAEEEAVGGPAILQERQRLFVKLGNDFRGLGGLGGFLNRLGNADGLAFAAGIGIGERAFESFAAKYNDEPVAFTGFDDDFDIADFFDFLFQDFDLCFANFGVDAASAPVGDQTFGVERAEIGAGGNVAGFEFNAETERFDDATTNFKFERIVAKQAEVAGAAAGSDAGRDGRQTAHCGVFGERVEIRSFGDFERSAKAGGFGGDIADAVVHDERDFGFVRDREIRINFIEIHEFAPGFCLENR